MRPVKREEILDLASYEKSREAIRPSILDAKRRRRVHVGGVLTFLFENTATVRYQVQEMLRAERIQKEPEIAHEIETYNELVGGKGELGCSLLIEITDPEERARKLTQWLALPKHLYVKTEDGEKHRARFDERQIGTDRLSSVQYLRFDVKGRQPIAVGSDLPGLTAETALDGEQREALRQDLASDLS
ncbi:MAG: DUF3501 family protein [Anaeromyxobacter sp.]